MPFSTDFKEEEEIYRHNYSNEKRGWNKEKRHTAHVAPHGLELLSLAAVMSRLFDSVENSEISLLQKALVYAGRVDTKVDSNMAKKLLEEFEYTKPSEGTSGLDTRFIQNVFETTEHFQVMEYLANIEKMKEDGGEQTMLSSISLSNPCVTALDLFVRLESLIKEVYAQSKTEKFKYIQKILPQAKEWIYSQIANDVYSAILKDESVVETTWKKYTDHVRAYARNTTLKDEVTQADIKSDESFMKRIESYIGVPEKDVFRKELSDAIGSVSNAAILLADEPSYESAIKKYVFENEFKSGENMKLLGWIKAGTSSAESNSKERECLNETINYLMSNGGYCGKCAHQALVITASQSQIVG